MAGRKLNTADLEQFRGLLNHLKQVIAGDIGHLEEDAFPADAERPPTDNPADAGSDRFSQEFSLELLARDEATYEEIQKALERIAEGTFGRCLGCEAWIPKSRLNAVPHAKNCIDCQRELERAG